MKIVDSSPHPSILIESLRDFGYTLESALADVIDNSLAAKAGNIDILANFIEGEEYVAIVDDGTGMTEAELLTAMRLGSRNPLDTREQTDLGRFGLGLKTASFSQCRKLTVVSRRDNVTSGATWDLDFVAETNRWDVILVEDFASVPGFELLQKSGTIVVWQHLDRLTEKSDRKSNEQYFEERMIDAIDHLSLVYHRFLRREGPHKAVRITVNQRPLSPTDPFMGDHPGTQQLEREEISYGNGRHKVILQGFTLPPYNRMSAQEWKQLGGKDGHIKNQGFYLYRERRLIIWGTWFGLASKAEVSKLARAQVDIGNDTDADWKIDVLKSSAQPPLPIRSRMRNLIRVLTEGSRQVHSGRRRTGGLNHVASGWITFHQGDQTRFEPNLEHPFIIDHMSSLTQQQKHSFHLVLRTLTSSLPMDQIYSRMSNRPEDVIQAALSDDELIALVHAVHAALSTAGVSTDSIRNHLRYEEPFRTAWEKVNRILQSLE